MNRALLLLPLVLALSCEKKSTTPPEFVPEKATHTTDPTGAECVAQCLEGDKFKDQELDQREASCKAECPDPSATPAEGEGGEAPAGDGEAAAEG
ncbi:MAG: hypothetical protein U0168_27660 [Nannocystaceae bacterium]